MFYAQNLVTSFLTEAMANAVSTQNCCPTWMLDAITSIKGPCIAHVHVFGCATYATVPNEKRINFDAKGTIFFLCLGDYE